MHVAITTTFYPNAAFPLRAIFVKNMVQSLRTLCEVTVIAPIPLAPGGWGSWPRREQALIPELELIDGLSVYHPRFIAFPGLELLSGATYFAGVCQVLRALKLKHSNLILHGHRIYPDGMGVALTAKRLNLPYVLTAHGSDINRTARRFGMKNQMRWALRNANVVIAVSAALKHEMLRLVQRDIHVVPCAGFDPVVFFIGDRKLARRSLALPQESRIVVFVGQLLRTKGIEVLVDAWERMKSTGSTANHDRLVLIGDGLHRNWLIDKIRGFGIEDSVLLTGTVAQQQIPLWINSSNVLCLPSFMEGTPNVIIESLACGVPVVATGVGGIPEVVTHNQNGMLVPAGNAKALASSLSKAMEQDWDRADLRTSVLSYAWSNLASRNYAMLRAIGGV